MNEYESQHKASSGYQTNQHHPENTLSKERELPRVGIEPTKLCISRVLYLLSYIQGSLALYVYCTYKLYMQHNTAGKGVNPKFSVIHNIVAQKLFAGSVVNKHPLSQRKCTPRTHTEWQNQLREVTFYHKLYLSLRVKCMKSCTFTCVPKLHTYRIWLPVNLGANILITTLLFEPLHSGE